MILKLLKYVWRSVARERTRSILTVLGIAAAMFLFCFIEGLQSGVRAATESHATDNVLIVYQRSRFCPATSNLPERYGDVIRKMPGVTTVLPVKIFLNNCRASLDAVTFKGVPSSIFTSGGGGSNVRLVSGEAGAMLSRRDAALVGARLAGRRGLEPGDRFRVGELDVHVAGIFDSDVPGEDNLAYVGLDYLQRTRGVDSVGRVTQFEVTVEPGTDVAEIALAIDQKFKTDEVQTQTKSHKAHLATATGDLLGLIKFTRLLGILCLGVVLGLTANTIFVMVQNRVKEHAVLQTLGVGMSQLFFIVVAESLLLSFGGGVLGTFAAAAALEFGHLGLGAEGVQISFMLTPDVVAYGLLLSIATGLLAGLAPAMQAAVAPIVESLRSS